jgi:hypothetical protein
VVCIVTVTDFAVVLPDLVNHVSLCFKVFMCVSLVLIRLFALV